MKVLQNIMRKKKNNLNNKHELKDAAKLFDIIQDKKFGKNSRCFLNAVTAAHKLNYHSALSHQSAVGRNFYTLLSDISTFFSINIQQFKFMLTIA